MTTDDVALTTNGTSAAATSPEQRTRRPRVDPGVVALVAAIVPAIVMTIRAAATGWVPLFDAAYFTVRSRDVATSHNPFVGAWSMGSREVGVWINNLGPLQLDLLAPFTKLDPGWGTALGVAATNVAAIVGVWFVARRMLGAVGVAGAMAATILLQLNEGSLMLIEARQQLALVLPMWCTLWLAAALWRGDRWMLPWFVFTASLVLQTHFTYAYQTVAVALAAAVGLVVAHRRTLPTLRRPVLAASVVALVCWASTAWDQFFASGNLMRVAEQSGGSSRSVGLSKGLTILAETGFVPPFFLPGSMGDHLRSGQRVSVAGAVVALVAWIVVLAGIAVAGRRLQRHGLGALATIASVAVAGSVYAAVKIPPTEQFGIIAQNYYWAWPVGIFAVTAVGGAAWCSVSALTARGFLQATAPWATAGATALFAIALLPATNGLPETSREWSIARFQARPMMDDLGVALDRMQADGAFEGPVLVDLGSVRWVRYTLLAELQARDIDFRFSPGSTDISRFGEDRCDDGSAGWYLSLWGGPNAVRINVQATLLAAAPGLSSEQTARLDSLAATFGDAIRSGDVIVDDGALAYFEAEIPVHLDQVRNRPGLSARGLGTFLSNYVPFEAVTVTDDLRDDLREFADLERAADEDRMAIYIEPIPDNRPNRCDEVDPGDGFVPGR